MLGGKNVMRRKGGHDADVASDGLDGGHAPAGIALAGDLGGA